MTDFNFSPEFEQFNATNVDLEPTSPAGIVWFENHFGRGAVSVNLRKTGAFEAAAAIRDAGLEFSVRAAS